jgi:hypothetical protein
MPAWLPLSRFGAGLAVMYLAVAIWVLIEDRTTTSGGWISLNGMSTYIVTMPVSAPFELLGYKLDFRRNLDMAVAIGGCTFLVYLVGAGLAWLAGTLVSPGPKE